MTNEASDLKLIIQKILAGRIRDSNGFNFSYRLIELWNGFPDCTNYVGQTTTKGDGSYALIRDDDIECLKNTTHLIKFDVTNNEEYNMPDEYSIANGNATAYSK